MDAFRFELSALEKDALKELVRASIRAALEGDRDWTPPAPPSARLTEPLGAFVTLHLGGELRGCIGRIVGDGPLWETVARMARAAAFEDPRFPPLAPAEFERLAVEISVLGPVTACPDPARVEVGRHGLIVRRGARQGLLLPQVAVEWRWDARTFLDHTCRKAGLEPGAWREPGTEVYWFEAEVF